MAENDQKLIVEKYVRNYMIKMIVPISACIAMIGFLLGFIIDSYKEIESTKAELSAKQKTEAEIEEIKNIVNDAVNDAQKRVLDLMSKVYEDQKEYTSNIMTKQKEAEKTIEEIQEMASSAEDLNNKVKELESIKNLKEAKNELKESLVSDTNFREQVVDSIERKTTKRLNEAEKIINDLRDNSINKNTKRLDEAEQKINALQANWMYATQVFSSQPGKLPLKGEFKSHGETLLILASGSGYERGQIGMEVYVNEKSYGKASTYSNEPDSHKTFTTGFIVISGLPAGTHKIELRRWKETQTDAFDSFNVVILETKIKLL